MAHTFDFSVLKLDPDAARGESINVGLVIFHPARLDVRFGDALSRARALYPDYGAETVEAVQTFFKRAGELSLPSAERHRMLSRIGLFALGSLGHFTVEESSVDEYEARVASLMELFVSPPRRQRPAASRGVRPITEVRNIFREERILANLGDAAAIHSHRIVPDWPLPNRPSIRADFALKNGIMRVAQVVDLSLDVDDGLPSQLFSSVVTLEVAFKQANAEKRVFAYRPSGNSRKVDEALRVAELHATQLVDLDDKTNRNDFVNEWIDAANDAMTPQRSLF